ncbi:TPA: phage holin [Enterococcus faecium]|jgi:phi LC3 family holin|uniref:phage holin n=1 Tax=Enterococcus TaxID=1350 RepID=UPI00098D3D12|nr:MULTISPECIES: phage holin [Enterococcus]OZS36817.1 phage holin [Enterococcus faecium]RDG07398.1 phage holin [Enterococcus faecium]RGW65771.1 phage holin [Enterococcus durans]RXE92186.1 phage holin [Enterococcus faecium]HAR1322427.1 phage holin [Enterococcus faecium]
MKNINWKVRMRNKSFWLAVVPAALLLAQVIAVPFGYNFEIDVINKQLLDIINAAFAFLSILGVVTDPTTKGVSDSEQALSYSKPKEDNKNE